MDLDNITPMTMEFKPREVRLPGELVPLAVHFLTNKKRRGSSENSMKAWQVDLEQFVGYMAIKDVTMVQTVTSALIEDFLDSMIRGELCSPRTAARKLASIRAMFKYATRKQLIKEQNDPTRRVDPIRFARTKVIAPDSDAILEMIENIPNHTPLGIRDRAIFMLMYDSALRVGGLCSLDVFHEKNPPKFTVWRNGVVTYNNKGGGVGESVIGEETREYLDRWLTIRHRYLKHDENQALFLTNRGARMNRHVMDYSIRRYGKAVGINHIHCHMLRHRRIGDIMDKTDIHLANYIAGHACLSTTIDIYGHQNVENMRARIRSKCPVNDKGERKSC